MSTTTDPLTPQGDSSTAHNGSSSQAHGWDMSRPQHGGPDRDPLGLSQTAPLPSRPADAARSRPPVRRAAVPPSLRLPSIVPRTLEEAMALARAVVAARMAPAGFDTAEACMIAILHGMEVGLTPLSALQRIAVIGGRPTIWGDGAMALVRASGLAASIDERILGSGPSDWVAVCTVARRGDPHPIERRFCVEDARRARLWGKPGPWSDYPQRMLQMRARAFALRDVFADVLGGLYLREEIEDGEETIQGVAGAWTQMPHATPAEATSNPSIAVDAHATANRDTGCLHNNERPSDQPASTERTPHARARQSKIIAPPPPPVAEECTAATSVPPAAQVNATEDDTAQHNNDVRPGPPSASKPPRAALTARRRTSGARTAQRMRFENGWAIRRPRTLAARPTSSVVNRTRTDTVSRPQPEVEPTHPAAGYPSPAEPRPSPSLTAHAVSSHEVLRLYEDALSCARDVATLADWAERDLLHPVIDSVFPLDQIALAEARVSSRRSRGKVVLLTEPPSP